MCSGAINEIQILSHSSESGYYGLKIAAIDVVSKIVLVSQKIVKKQVNEYLLPLILTSLVRIIS